jgi:hypothetical protein
VGTEHEAYKSAFWDALRDCPVLRGQLVELLESRSIRELGEQWGYSPPENVRDYVRGPLRRRLEREVGREGVEFLMRCCGERAI